MNTAPINIRPLKPGLRFEVKRQLLPGVDGVELEQLTFVFSEKGVPAPVRLEWEVPLLDICGKWHPSIGSDRSLSAEWYRYTVSYATLNAPVYSLFSAAGENRLTFALSDAIAPLKLQVLVNEETACARCVVVLFDAPTPEMTEYRVTLRRDWRGVGYAEAIGAVATWWEGMPEYKPAVVPASGFEPVYSTWYGFHQELSPEAIEEECRWARDIGCGVVIVDDGWQCDDNNKGYDYCGDWEIASSKFPDFPAHVRRVQAMGLKYMLWFSVPYAGIHSRAWRRFQDRVLVKPRSLADCLDPRYKEVRDYLVACYRRAIEEWGIDGLKLDFVDCFTAETAGASIHENADMASVPAAADALLTETMRVVQRTKPDALIEFRQKYIGPAMRKYGNLFRATDCPNDALSNRIRTIDVRLLAGRTAVHSDMLMWHPEEAPEQVAIQLWSTVFSVPQISVRRAAITPAQERVIYFYLGFWMRHRETLLDGRFEPESPQELYPVVQAAGAGVRIVVFYAATVARVAVKPGERLVLVNATSRPGVIIEVAGEIDLKEQQVFSCQGDEVIEAMTKRLAGVVKIPVPAAGVGYLVF